jgi:hypothetical protein
MLHYAVNRPLGALLGESDLTTLLPWLQRYSRMLEDRVRLHWAMRAFLWMVTVPASKIREKQEQYRQPPEAGSIIVKDETETWQPVAPQLHSADAHHDLQAVRQMIDAGSGYPPHWRGEAAEANLATATAMQAPTERHLQRRQQYFAYMLQDILYQAYQRRVQAGRARPLTTIDYSRLFSLSIPDISRSDNEALARSARDIAQGLASLTGLVSSSCPASSSAPATSSSPATSSTPASSTAPASSSSPTSSSSMASSTAPDSSTAPANSSAPDSSSSPATSSSPTSSSAPDSSTAPPLPNNTAFKRLALKLFMKFAGEPLAEDELNEIIPVEP